MKPTLSPLPLPLNMIALLAALVLAVSALAATVNFAQSDQIVAPAPADAHRLATYFSPPYHAGPLPDAVEEALMRSAPPELRAGCAATVASWAPAAHGSSHVSVRILAATGGSAWLAYRCESGGGDSRPPPNGNYSERLAVFNSARRTIQFLSLQTNGAAAATFYHIGLAGTMKLRGAESSAAFIVFATGLTAQGGSAPASLAETRYVVIANSATEAKLVLALVTARNRPGAPDSETSVAGTPDSADYRAAMRFDHDPSGHLTAVNQYYRDAPSGARSHYGVSRFVWNPAAFEFASAKPVLPRTRRKSVLLPPVPGYHPLAN